MFGKRKIATIVAEFLGTGILTLLVLSVQRSTIGVPFFVAMAAGLTVALMTFSVGRLSGAHLNPALTLALWTARKISTVNAVLYIGMQLLGGWAAYYLYSYFVNNSLQFVGGHFSSRILVAEAVGTAIFAFGWAATLYQRFSPAVTASVAGLAYMVGIIASSAAAIGLLNPALALGVRAWVWGSYVLGPVVGAVIGVNLYGLLFAGNEAADVRNDEMSTGSTSELVVATTTTTSRKPRTATKRVSAKTPAKKTTTKRATSRRTTRTR